jgi:hypothetical protein
MPMHPDDDVSDEIQTALRAVDHPVPAVTAETIAKRARAAARPAPEWRWAAAVLLTLGAAGAAFALPGSPLRRWATAFAAGARGKSAPAPDSSVAPGVQTPDRSRGGIAVPPGRALLIVFNRPAPAAVAVVSLVGGSEVLVRAPTGVATFTTDANRLLVEWRTAASAGDRSTPRDTIAIGIPRTSPRVEIRSGPTRLFLKRGDRITSPSPVTTGGSWVLPLGPASGSP